MVGYQINRLKIISKGKDRVDRVSIHTSLIIHVGTECRLDGNSVKGGISEGIKATFT